MQKVVVGNALPPDTDDTPDLHLGKNKPDDATQPRYESSKAR